MEKNINNQHTSLRSKRVILSFVIVSVLIIGIAAIIFVVHRTKKNASLTDNQDKSIISTQESTRNTIQKYGKQSEINNKELFSSSTAVWNRDKIDSVYFNLIYADKVGSFSDVYKYLGLLQIAQQNGVNIDNNQYGINQKTRDDLKERADVIARSVKQGTP